MPAINSIFVEGYITREPELRYVGSGTALVSFAVVHNRNFQRNGEWRKESTFVDCKAWGTTAERAGDLNKGDHVIVAGRLQQERWQTKDGSERRRLVIIADRIDPVSLPKEPVAKASSRTNHVDDDLPF